MLRRLLPWAIGAFVIFAVVNNPTGSAANVKHLFSKLGDVADGLSQFFTSVTS